MIDYKQKYKKYKTKYVNKKGGGRFNCQYFWQELWKKHPDFDNSVAIMEMLQIPNWNDRYDLLKYKYGIDNDIINSISGLLFQMLDSNDEIIEAGLVKDHHLKV